MARWFGEYKAAGCDSGRVVGGLGRVVIFGSLWLKLLGANADANADADAVASAAMLTAALKWVASWLLVGLRWISSE